MDYSLSWLNVSKIKIQNHTGGTITIYLTGAQNYTFSVGTGNQSIQIVPGKYSFTVYGCGTSISGQRNLNKGYVWMFWCSSY